MKYTCVDASNGMEYDLKATNEQEAILEAFEDMTRGFDTRPWSDFSNNARDGKTYCHIDKWADDAADDDDDPVASASIAWDFGFQTDYNTDGEYRLKEIKVELFDDTELTVSGQEDFADIVKKAMSNN